MPNIASQMAFCRTASRQVKAVSANSRPNARPPGISPYRRKAPKVTSIRMPSALPWTGRLIEGRVTRIRQPQTSKAISANAMPASRNSIGTETRAAAYLSRKLTPKKRISKPPLATRFPPNSQSLALRNQAGGSGNSMAWYGVANAPGTGPYPGIVAGPGSYSSRPCPDGGCSGSVAEVKSLSGSGSETVVALSVERSAALSAGPEGETTEGEGAVADEPTEAVTCGVETCPWISDSSR